MRVKHRPSFICDRKGEKFLQVLIFRQIRSDLGSKGHSDVLQILNIINVFIPCLNRVLGIMFGLVSKEAKKNRAHFSHALSSENSENCIQSFFH